MFYLDAGLMFRGSFDGSQTDDEFCGVDSTDGRFSRDRFLFSFDSHIRRQFDGCDCWSTKTLAAVTVITSFTKMR